MCCGLLNLGIKVTPDHDVCIISDIIIIIIGQCYFIIEDDFESTELRIERGIRARISNREAVKFENS